METNIKTALVTGASRGIGRATALALAEAGYDIFVHFYQSHEAAKEIASQIRLLGRKAWVVQADVRNEGAIRNLFDEISKQVPSLDLLVNNAGLTYPQTIEEIPTEQIWELIGVLLVGKMLVTKYALPLLKNSKEASIINISSRTGCEKILERVAVYSAAQAGVIQWTKCCALEFSPYKVRVNAIAPGLIDTDITRLQWSEEYLKNEVQKANLVGRLGQPEEVANAVLFLASAKSAYINGAVLQVTGGNR